MWSVKSIRMNQFGLVASDAVEFEPNARSIFVRGDNRDVTYASSNMAGKTTLISALTWCLFGTDVSGKRLAGDVVKQGATSCVVECTFAAGDKSMEVARTRGIGIGGSIEKVCIQDHIGYNKVGSSAEVQPHVDAVFGCVDLFLAAHVFAAEDGQTPFALQPDKAQKQLFDLLIDSSDLDAGYERARVVLAAANKKQRDVQMQALRITANLEAMKTHQVQVFDPRAKELELAEAALEKVDTELLAAQHDRDVASRKKDVALISAAEDRARRVDRPKKWIEDHIAETKHLIANLCVESLSIKAFTKCPTCLKEVTGNQATKIRRKRDELIQCLSDATTEWVSRLSFLHSTSRGSTFVELRASELQEEFEKVDQRVVALKAARYTAQATFEAMRNQVVQNKQLDDTNRIKQLRLKAQQISTDNTLKRLDSRIADLEFWLEGFGPKGIRAYRLDKITPTLNALASQYASLLFGDGTSVVYSTQRRLKSGDLREAFTVQLQGKDKNVIPSPSAGQCQRRDIIHTFAIADLAGMLGKRTVNLIVLDEVFRSVDKMGIDAVSSILDSRARAEITKDDLVLVVEHNDELAVAFPNVLTAIRENGSTTYEFGGEL